MPRRGGVVSVRIHHTSSYVISARTWREAHEWLLGLAAVPVGGGLVWLQCPWEMVGGGCGAHERLRGVAAVLPGCGVELVLLACPVRLGELHDMRV